MLPNIGLPPELRLPASFAADLADVGLADAGSSPLPIGQPFSTPLSSSIGSLSRDTASGHIMLGSPPLSPVASPAALSLAAGPGSPLVAPQTVHAAEAVEAAAAAAIASAVGLMGTPFAHLSDVDDFPSDKDGAASSGPRVYCAFPGCPKHYASQDGVRKHAKRYHMAWLAQLDLEKKRCGTPTPPTEDGSEPRARDATEPPLKRRKASPNSDGAAARAAAASGAHPSRPSHAHAEAMLRARMLEPTLISPLALPHPMMLGAPGGAAGVASSAPMLFLPVPLPSSSLPMGATARGDAGGGARGGGALSPGTGATMATPRAGVGLSHALESLATGAGAGAGGSWGALSHSVSADGPGSVSNDADADADAEEGAPRAHRAAPSGSGQATQQHMQQQLQQQLQQLQQQQQLPPGALLRSLQQAQQAGLLSHGHAMTMTMAGCQPLLAPGLTLAHATRAAASVPSPSLLPPPLASTLHFDEGELEAYFDDALAPPAASDAASDAEAEACAPSPLGAPTAFDTPVAKCTPGGGGSADDAHSGW